MERIIERSQITQRIIVSIIALKIIIGNFVLLFFFFFLSVCVFFAFCFSFFFCFLQLSPGNLKNLIILCVCV